MAPINRRVFLGAGMASAGIAVGNTGRAQHVLASPKRRPDLTDDHLASVNAHMADTQAPRVLVIGNSATIQSNFWDYLTDAATLPPAHLARASANGARLAETARIQAVQGVLIDIDWDVVVMQDFSSTALNSADREASVDAICVMASLARPASVVLFPHWPSAPGHRVYSGGLGARVVTPANFADYVARSQAHYNAAARQCGGVVAPVLEAWEAALRSGEDLYVADRHHANQKGAMLAARAVWRTVAEQL